jgi:hypothetical protein
MLDSEPTLLGVLIVAWNYLFGSSPCRIDGIWQPLKLSHSDGPKGSQAHSIRIE